MYSYIEIVSLFQEWIKDFEFLSYIQNSLLILKGFIKLNNSKILYLLQKTTCH